MKLKNVIFGFTPYHHIPSGKIVTVLNCLYADGACLIFQSLDDVGDMGDGEIFTGESYEIEPCGRDHWNARYPVGSDCLTFEEGACGRDWGQ